MTQKIDNQTNHIYNADLVRTIATIFVVTFHLSFYGNIESEGLTGSVLTNYRIFSFLSYSALYTVNAYFVLLSGYLLVFSKFNIKRIFFLYISIVFYSLILYGIGVLTGIRPFNLELLYLNIIPVKQYWFFQVYLCFYIITPFINVVISSISKSVYKLLIILCIILCYYWKSLNPSYFLYIDSGFGNVLLAFILCYMIGAYIRKYGLHEIKFSKLSCIFSYIFFTLVHYITTSQTILRFLNLNKYVLTEYLRLTELMLFIATLSLFFFLVRIQVRKRIIQKVVKTLAPLGFGVYLIHDSNHIRNWLYIQIKNTGFIQQDTLVFLVLTLLYILLVYVICCVIEKLRLMAFKKIENITTIKHFFDSLQNKYNQLWEK